MWSQDQDRAAETVGSRGQGWWRWDPLGLPLEEGGERRRSKRKIENPLPPHFLLLPSLVNYLGPFYSEMMMELTKTNSSFRFVNKLENIGAFFLKKKMLGFFLVFFLVSLYLKVDIVF